MLSSIKRLLCEISIVEKLLVQMYEPLCMIARTPHIKAYLENNDQKTLDLVESAINNINLYFEEDTNEK